MAALNFGVFGIVIHRLSKKTTEDTEIYREHRKNFFFAPSASLLSPRLRFTLGVLCALGGLGVPIHRLTQIYTDWMVEPRISQIPQKKIRANLCNL